MVYVGASVGFAVGELVGVGPGAEVGRLGELVGAADGLGVGNPGM